MLEGLRKHKDWMQVELEKYKGTAKWLKQVFLAMNLATKKWRNNCKLLIYTAIIGGCLVSVLKALPWEINN